MSMTVRNFGRSALGSVFSYIFVGTSIFFAITLFKKLGTGFFNINQNSIDIWWNIMFYLAIISYYLGLRSLVKLANGDDTSMKIGSENIWGLVVAIILIVIFIIPKWADPFISQYANSALSGYGFHNFIAFLMAGLLGSYLLIAHNDFGLIGKAIATPMMVVVWAFCMQHLWGLLFKWYIINPTINLNKGVEIIILIIASVSIAAIAVRIDKFTKKG
jgi:hypothetical protein